MTAPGQPTTRPPRRGERCVCGKLARIVYIKRMGDVPSCQRPHIISPY